MANVKKYLADILSAIYGEEVRGSIHDAIEAMNEESSAAYETAITAQDSAANSAAAAKVSEDNAKTSEDNAKESEDNAKTSELNAKESEDNAKESEDNAKTSELNAKDSEDHIEQLIDGFDDRVATGVQTITTLTTTKEGEIEAYTQDKKDELSAQASASISEMETIEQHVVDLEASATTQASNASVSAQEAATQASNASASAQTATAQAGNASASAQEVAQLVQSLSNALVAKGTITFEQLPTSGMQSGWMYNISNNFTTDSRFKDGSGLYYDAGNNVYYTVDGYWDVLSSQSLVVVVDDTLDVTSQNPIQNGVVARALNTKTGIDDTAASTTSTYSSSKIEQRIATAAGATIDDSTTGLTTTYSSNKIENIVADLIDDTTSDTDTTYSSDKIETLISTSVGSVIDDTTASATTTYSSTKIENVVSGLIDDTSTSLTETWSSDKLSSELGSKASIDDTSSSVSTTYSSDKIDSLVGGGGAFIDDTQTSTTTVYSSSKTETVIDTSLSDLLNLLYPVGCIVHTTAYSTSAQMVAVYGGTTWELITNRMLIGAGSTYTVGATGGSSSVTLTTSNLPSHTHSYTLRNSSTGSTTLTTNQIPSHTHSIWTSTGILCAGGSNYGLVANNQQDSTSGATGGGGSHYHSISGSSSSTGSTGSGTSFSIVNPYKAVYIWTRTA